MAIAYSVQYDNAFIPPLVSMPARQVYGRTTKLPFTFVNPASGGLATIGDLVYLVKVPACCEIVVFESLFRTSAWTASTTIDIGWLAYTGPNGVVVAADDNGLIDNMDIDAAGYWHHGTTHSSTATIVHNAPVVDVYTVRATAAVTITAVFRDTAPLASATIAGYLTVQVD